MLILTNQVVEGVTNVDGATFGDAEEDVDSPAEDEVRDMI